MEVLMIDQEHGPAQASSRFAGIGVNDDVVADSPPQGGGVRKPVGVPAAVLNQAHVEVRGMETSLTDPNLPYVTRIIRAQLPQDLGIIVARGDGHPGESGPRHAQSEQKDPHPPAGPVHRIPPKALLDVPFGENSPLVF
jgi:hypothetical protein